ncbi:MAG: divergent polysaccharide deacetylase family protein [Pseudomonadota bacterium]
MARFSNSKKFKAPVFSRLFLAWTGTIAVCGIGLAALAYGKAPAVKIAIKEAIPQRMAPPERLAQPAKTTGQLALSRGALSTPTNDTMLGQTQPANIEIGRARTYNIEKLNTDQLDEGVSVRASTLIGENASQARPTALAETRGPRVIKIEQPERPTQEQYSSIASNSFSANDIIITVDGKPARSINGGGPAGRRAMTPTPIAAIDPSLRRLTSYGPVPSIAPNGARPADVYAFNFRPTELPNVAMIVGGLGLNRDLTERAISELPAAVSLAFAPYAKNLEVWANRARAAGHEILIELPMEQNARSTVNLGPAALLTSRTRDENLKRLDWLLSRFEGYFGVTNYLGAQFSGDRTAINPILTRLRASGLAYFDDTGAVLRFTDPAARNVSSITRVIAPGTTDPAADLALLERVAKRDGLAVGKAYAAPDVFDELSAWAWSLEDKQLMLAPASAAFTLRKSEL